MAKLLQHHTVVRDGFHNMLTDLAYWRDYYWLIYCRRSDHYSIDGGLVVLRSVDLKRWHEVAYIKTEGDDREAKFCIANDRLFVYFGTFLGPSYIGLNSKAPISFVTNVCFTNDGLHWSKPKAIWTNQWIWQVHHHNGNFYGTAYGWQGEPRNHVHGPLDLLTSKDGFSWQKISTIAGVEDLPNEADFAFQSDGELWIIARTWREPWHSIFYSAKPPYQTWERVDLKMTIHCPNFCECDGKLYVAGRRDNVEPWRVSSVPTSEMGDSSYAELLTPGSTAIWLVEKGKLIPVFALPSDGDAAYPGLISREPNKLILSYYSQHAYLSGVLSSKIPIPPSGARPDIYSGDDDIYISEISLN